MAASIPFISPWDQGKLSWYECKTRIWFFSSADELDIPMKNRQIKKALIKQRHRDVSNMLSKS